MRLFVAIDIPEEIKSYFSQIQEQIGNDLAKVNWVKKENIHITLKFLGEVSDVERVKEILSSVKFEPFSLITRKIGVFPDESYVKVIWVGFKETEKLFELHKLVDMSLSKLFGMEKRFLGHITLGRVKFVKDKEAFVDRIKAIKVEEREFKVDKFKLYKSTLTEQGPVYEVVGEYELDK